jgi:hypothetical protein
MEYELLNIASARILQSAFGLMAVGNEAIELGICNFVQRYAINMHTDIWNLCLYVTNYSHGDGAKLHIINVNSYRPDYKFTLCSQRVYWYVCEFNYTSVEMLGNHGHSAMWWWFFKICKDLYA